MSGILCRYLVFYAGGLHELRPRHDAPEPAHGGGGLGQQRRRPRRAGQPRVAIEQPEETLRVLLFELDQRHELVVDETAVRVEQEALAARHAGAQVPPVRTEHDDGAARHVLARVVADTLDHRHRAGVADREALPRRTGDVQLTAGGAVEDGVADEAGIADVTGRWGDRDPAAAHRLADVVVGVADERELDTRREERAEALARRALE